MTQEELDALMAGDIDEESLSEEPEVDADEILDEVESAEESYEGYENYKIDANKAWPPPPPSQDHKMVYQLDDVTKESELKATEIFDKLETISQYCIDGEEDLNSILEVLNSNVDIFEKLSSQFSHIETFKSALESNKQAAETIENAIGNLQMSSDEVMMIMDIMQFQDIHRQKIERVINVMRALSKYMATLFESQVDDSKRVSSAVHIQGDETTEDVVSNEDIEALIASLGQKK